MNLYLGGDVGQETFHILHPYELKNAREVRTIQQSGLVQQVALLLTNDA